jgi:hypothetical protein
LITGGEDPLRWAGEDPHSRREEDEMGRKITFALTFFLAVVLLAAPSARAGFAQKFKKQLKTHVKREYGSGPQSKTITISTGNYETVTFITIDAPRAGTVKVSATGHMEFQDPDDTGYVTIHTAADAQGANFIYDNGALNRSYHLEEYFEVAKGLNTFYINADGFGSAGARTITVYVLSAEALFMSNAISNKDW